MKNKVKEILCFVLNLGQDYDMSEANIDVIKSWDSIKQVSIISAIENEFDLFIEVEDAINLTSYEKIIQFLEENA